MRGVQSAGVRWLQAVGAKEGIIGRGEVEKSRSCSDIIQNKTAVKNGRRDGVLWEMMVWRFSGCSVMI